MNEALKALTRGETDEERKKRIQKLVCSYQVFQEALGYSRPTISKAIKLLRDHQYISTAKSGATNVYFINKNLYWNSYGTNYAYAEFGAKIIITASEQDKEEQEEIKLEVKNRREARIETEARS